MLQHAIPQDAKDLYAVFRGYSDIFPHIRYDRIQRMCEAGHVIYDAGIIITYQTYRKAVRLGQYRASKDTVVLHQIVKAPQAARGAAAHVFRTFLAEYVPTCLVLSVRADNRLAWTFYERHGLQRVSEITWHQQGHPLPGYVYLYSPSGALPW